MPKVIGKSAALFGDGTLAVTDHLRLIGGLRETEEAKSRYGIGGNIALTLGGAGPTAIHNRLLHGHAHRHRRLRAQPAGAPELRHEQGGDAAADGAVPDADDDDARRARHAQRAGRARSPTARNPMGNCFVRSDIDNGFVTCPTDQNGGFSYANLTVPEQQVGSSKFHYTDWRLGTEYDLTKDNMVYVKVSTGHKAGGFNDSFNGSTVPELFRPEQLQRARGRLAQRVHAGRPARGVQPVGLLLRLQGPGVPGPDLHHRRQHQEPAHLQRLLAGQPQHRQVQARGPGGRGALRAAGRLQAGHERRAAAHAHRVGHRRRRARDRLRQRRQEPADRPDRQPAAAGLQGQPVDAPAAGDRRCSAARPTGRRC